MVKREPRAAFTTLHIRCGDDIKDKLAEAGIEGDYLSFTDPAWLGPPPSFNAWIAGRAALIAERSGIARAKVREELGAAYWRLARAPQHYSHIVLWFEHDLYDQSALARILAGFALRKKRPKIDLIAIDRFPGVKRFLGLGQLSPAELASLWPKRRPVGKRQLDAGTRIWAALCAPTPQPLMAIVAQGVADLPLMKAALERQLQELPWTTDGLSLTEREALRALAKDPLSGAEVFATAQLKREPQPFMGDLFFFAVLRDLLESPQPPIAVSPGTRRAVWPRRMLSLTPVGRAVLDGKVDWQTQSPLERWVGGIPISRRDPPWRWNPKTKSVSLGTR
jgi:hypothetical protein